MAGVAAVAVLLAAALLGAAGARVATVRVQGAADAAATAGAAALVGLLPDEPCAIAERTVRGNGVTMASCAASGAVVRVRVHQRAGPFDLAASALAGPAPPDR